MNRTAQQIRSHGVEAATYPFASFCYGRGWKGHKTFVAANKAAQRDARRVAEQTRGGLPQHFVANSATGELM